MERGKNSLRRTNNPFEKRKKFASLYESLSSHKLAENHRSHAQCLRGGLNYSQFIAMASFINAIPSSEGQGDDFKRILCSIPCTIENASDYLHQKLFPRKFCKDTWKVPEEDFDKALKKTEHAIETIWKNALSMPLDDTDARFVKFGILRLATGFFHSTQKSILVCHLARFNSASD